jgi:RNA polymerase sigma-70 factor, ECF subfamily
MAEARPRGGHDQLAQEIARHVGALRRYVLVLTSDPREVDDLVRECLRRALARTRAWRPVRDLRTHLFATVHDVVFDASRRRRPRVDLVPVDDVLAGLPLPASQPRRLEMRALIKGLAALPEQQREVVLLIGLEGMGYAEAAHVLGVPIGTVMSRLARGRAALHRLMTHGTVAGLHAVKSAQAR